MLQTKANAVYYSQALNQFNRTRLSLSAEWCWCFSCELISAHALRFQISHACCVFDRVLLQRDVSLRLSGWKAGGYSPFISESTQYEQICGLNPQPWTENGLEERCCVWNSSHLAAGAKQWGQQQTETGTDQCHSFLDFLFSSLSLRW